MLTIVIPVFNESDNIEPLIDQIYDCFERKLLKFDVLVVDDGSTDITPKILEEIRQARVNFHLLSLDSNLGKETSIRVGLLSASTKLDNNLILLMDGDFQHRPIDGLNLVLEYLRIRKIDNQDYCFVVAAKRLDYYSFLSTLRRFLSFGLKVFLGDVYTRTLRVETDFMVFDRKVLLNNPDILSNKGFFRFHIGRCCHDVFLLPVKIEQRLWGKTKYRYRDIFLNLSQTLTSSKEMFSRTIRRLVFVSTVGSTFFGLCFGFFWLIGTPWIGQTGLISSLIGIWSLFLVLFAIFLYFFWRR